MLVLKNIYVTVGKGTPLERPVLKGIDIQAMQGEVIALIGGNGTGKSTLFNVISGFIKPEKGKILLKGQDITAQTQAERSKRISLVMQDPRLGTMENLSIYENMAFAFRRGRSRFLIPFATRARKTLFQEKLSQLEMGLENRLDLLVGGLSGGQRQALSLVMALLADADVILLDEITAALDPDAAARVMDLASRMLRQDGKTGLMITHQHEQAQTYADRTLLLRDGILHENEPAKDKIAPLTHALKAG